MALAKVTKIMLRNTAASHGQFMVVDRCYFAPYSLNPCFYGEQFVDFYTNPYGDNLPDELYTFLIRATHVNSASFDSPVLDIRPNLDIYLFTSEPWVAYRGKVTIEHIRTYSDGLSRTIRLGFCLYHDKNPVYKINTESIVRSTAPRIVPGIERIIFNDPATIVYWTDGTKTVVKAHEDEFSEEHGLAMAMARKFLECRGCEFPRASFKRLVKEATR